MLVAAIGMTLVILARQIDISVGSQFSVCGIVGGLLAQAGLPMPLWSAAPSCCWAACWGASMARSIARLGLPSIVVTLATMVILREGLRWWREASSSANLPAGFSVVRPRPRSPVNG